MQGVAAHDLIESEAPKQSGAAALEARLAVGSPPRRLTARPHKLEPHGPSVIERELGEELHPERNAQHGHPGVDCQSLPAAHAHRLPGYNEARQLQSVEEREAPLLVAVGAAEAEVGVAAAAQPPAEEEDAALP